MMLYENYLIEEVLPIYKATAFGKMEEDLATYLESVESLTEEEADIVCEMIDDAVSESKRQLQKALSSVLTEAKAKGKGKPGALKKAWKTVGDAANRYKTAALKKARKAGKFVGKHKVGAAIAGTAALGAGAYAAYKAKKGKKK